MILTKDELIGWIENEIALSMDDDEVVTVIDVKRACWTVIDNFREREEVNYDFEIDDAFFAECLVVLNGIWE